METSPVPLVKNDGYAEAVEILFAPEQLLHRDLAASAVSRLSDRTM